MARAQTAAGAGDTVYFRDGDYKCTSSTAAIGVDLTKSGASGRRINYWAYPGETPVFDFYGMTAQERIKGINISASWIHLKGLELKGVPQNLRTVHESWCIYINGGSNNIFEQLNLHNHMGPGLFIVRGGNNLVLNCDSHDNYDEYSSSNGTSPNAPGENADGFGCHNNQAGNTGNVFRGCRAWWNTDDGFDLIHEQEPVIIENCWTWNNGYIPGTTTAIGNGNGFKAGGYGMPPSRVPATLPKHTVRFCVAFRNRSSGFYANHHPIANYWYNNTGYRNGTNFNMLGVDIATGGDVNFGVLRNNLAYSGTAISNGTGSGVDAAYNSWNLSSISLSDADFQSVAITGWDAPRQPDGSLPVLQYLRLAPGSDCIDKGQDVGLAFSGSAPDLGAFEDGAVGIERQNRAFTPELPTVYKDPAAQVLRVFDLSGRIIQRSVEARSIRPVIYSVGKKAIESRPYAVIQIH